MNVVTVQNSGCYDVQYDSQLQGLYIGYLSSFSFKYHSRKGSCFILYNIGSIIQLSSCLSSVQYYAHYLKPLVQYLSEIMAVYIFNDANLRKTGNKFPQG